LIAALVVVGLLYSSYRLGLRPAASSGQAKAFIIKTGESAPTIASHLKAASLIRDRTAFITYLNLHGLRSQLKAGSYSLAPTMSGQRIAGVLTNGKTLTNRIVIPEGYTMAQIEKLAAERGISTAAFQAAVAAPHSQGFLAGKPASVDLEGYLFPDSYQVDTNTTAAMLVTAMLDNFGTKVGSEYVQAFAAEGLSLHQGLTLASIVERESGNATDQPTVAQVFLKRLKINMAFQSDVTVQYGADLMGKPFSTTLNSPYNTYLHVGLPPGPISNPGLSALDAVAHPAQTDYLYFVADKKGQTHFARTFAEHQANIAKYLR
jgi:UPF0755 protein